MATASCPAPSESARKFATLIFQRLSSVGQDTVAEAISTSESTVSRLKAEVPLFAAMPDRLGLKVVPAEMRCYPEKTLAAILELAHQRMAQIESPQHLAQDFDD